MRHSVTILSLVALSMFGGASGAAAQSDSRWEIEVHGGGAFERGGTDGRGALPPAGEPFTTVTGMPSRRASSWQFGDGALLLNQINASFTSSLVSGRIASLDTVLQSAAARHTSGGSFGFRVARSLTQRFGVEFTLDASQGHTKLTDDARAGIESTRSSFISAWNERTGLIASGGGIVFINPVVASTATIDDGHSRQLFTTGTLTINLTKPGRIVPYAAIGLGVSSNRGELPQATLASSYRFDSLNVVPGYFPVSESDTVTVRVVAAHEHPVTFVAGGGVRFHQNKRGGFRADARGYIDKNTLDVLLDATPHVNTTALPLGVIASNLVPSIQFTNLNVLLTSTLSGPAINGFKTFASSGTAVHVVVSAGYFFRF